MTAIPLPTRTPGPLPPEMSEVPATSDFLSGTSPLPPGFLDNTGLLSMGRKILLFRVSAILFYASVLSAEMRIVAERNEGAEGTAAFMFKTVPPPSKTDAASRARFSLVSGRADPHGGDPAVLTDGSVPLNADHPQANFFFDAGTDGGRLMLDLGTATEVLQVNTYSWHPHFRGPQVFRLYASAGLGADLGTAPAMGDKPGQSGWKLLADIDTRPAAGKPGGQHGVSIRESNNGSLGRFRYLLFEIASTQPSNRFANTFFSEIDVCDGREHAPPVATSQKPGFQITFDTSQMPELGEWVDKRLRPTCEQWYPRIVTALPSAGFTAPNQLSVLFRRDMPGVAATSGTRILCAGEWFRGNMEGEAVGAVIHELVHVVQQYGRNPGGKPNPGWLVEGVADYFRWFHFEPPSLRPRPDPQSAHYTDGYRTTAAFLAHVAGRHGAGTVENLNAAMREGRYAPELWEKLTGMGIDQLWEEYLKAIRER